MLTLLGNTFYNIIYYYNYKFDIIYNYYNYKLIQKSD